MSNVLRISHIVIRTISNNLGTYMNYAEIKIIEIQYFVTFNSYTEMSK